MYFCVFARTVSYSRSSISTGCVSDPKEKGVSERKRIRARTVSSPCAGSNHCGSGRWRDHSGSPAPCSSSKHIEFSSAEKNWSSGATPSDSVSRSRASSLRARAWPLTKMSKPGSSPSTTMYRLAAIAVSMSQIRCEFPVSLRLSKGSTISCGAQDYASLIGTLFAIQQKGDPSDSKSETQLKLDTP